MGPNATTEKVRRRTQEVKPAMPVIAFGFAVDPFTGSIEGQADALEPAFEHSANTV